MATLSDHLVPVYRAQTQEEKEAVYRFRYDVYVEEMGRYQDKADHEKKWLKDRADDAQNALLLYCGSIDKMSATSRVTIWDAGKIPGPIIEKLSAHLIPGIEKLNTAEITRLIVDPHARNRFIFPSLIVYGYKYMASEVGTDLTFFQCIPELVPHFKRLGARPYSGALLEGGASTLVPSLMVLSDFRYLKACGSFLAPYAKEFFIGPGPEKRKPLNTVAIEKIFMDTTLPVELDALRIWDDVQENLLKTNDQIPNFLDKLEPDLIESIAKAGMILSVHSGSTLITEGTMDRQMYLVLEGRFEVVVRGKPVGVLIKGELFGEMAFFNKEERRTATIKSLSNAKVLVIGQKFLRTLMINSPEAALKIVLNIGRIMSDRFAAKLLEKI